MTSYQKPALTFEQQIDKLEVCGIIIKDRKLALQHLSAISYYQLSAYWYPYKVRKNGVIVGDQIEPGTSFEQVIEIYEFDRQLRLLAPLCDIAHQATLLHRRARKHDKAWHLCRPLWRRR